MEKNNGTLCCRSRHHDVSRRRGSDPHDVQGMEEKADTSARNHHVLESDESRLSQPRTSATAVKVRCPRVKSYFCEGPRGHWLLTEGVCRSWVRCPRVKSYFCEGRSLFALEFGPAPVRFETRVFELVYYTLRRATPRASRALSQQANNSGHGPHVPHRSVRDGMSNPARSNQPHRENTHTEKGIASPLTSEKWAHGTSRRHVLPLDSHPLPQHRARYRLRPVPLPPTPPQHRSRSHPIQPEPTAPGTLACIAPLCVYHVVHCTPCARTAPSSRARRHGTCRFPLPLWRSI